MTNPWKPTRKYWNAYNALYGEQLELGVGKSTPSPKKPSQSQKKAVKIDCRSEQEEQFAVHAWLERKNIVHHHSPNGGYRDAREAAKFKRMGTSPGFPDFIFPYARNGFHGLFIELKRLSGGKLSDHQVWWRDFLIKQGYAAYEAKGANECIRIVCEYLNLTEEGKPRESI